MKTQQLQTNWEDILKTLFMVFFFIYISGQLMSLRKKRQKRLWDLVISVKVSLILLTSISCLSKFLFLTVTIPWLEIFGKAVNMSMAPVFWSKDRGSFFPGQILYSITMLCLVQTYFSVFLLFNSRNTEIHLGERDMAYGEEHLLKKK